jgi:hypothetical protein
MFSSYLPNLKKPSNNSSKHYKDFHNIFYLSQITNLTLISYMDSFIEFFSKEQILLAKKDELIKKRIISITNIGNEEILVINNEDAFRAYDLEDFIPQIIEEKIKSRFSEMSHYLMCMGVKLDENMEKEIDIEIENLLKTTNTTNWYLLVKGFLNIWEFLFLYSTLEMTMTQIINQDGWINANVLLSELYKIELDLEKTIENNGFLNSQGNLKLWSLYTELRNLYSHSHGMLTQSKKNDISGKLNDFKNSLKELDLINQSLMDMNNIFKNSNMKVGKFYLLKDEELNMFRNFVITLMESYDELHIKKRQ